MKYFTRLPLHHGLNPLPENPCQLLDFQLLKLDDDDVYEGESGDREILAVILGGKANFTVGEQQFSKVGGRPNVFAGKPHSVYIPCKAKFSIGAAGPVEIAVVSAPANLQIPPYLIAPDHVTQGTWGAANFSRNYHQILTLAGQPDLPAQRLIVGETYTPSGNWSTFPPHKHEIDHLPKEAFHEEMYYFKVTPADGFGLCRYYNEELDTSFVVKNDSILMAPKGYHTVVSAPGYTTYYLWFLAGNQRVQATLDDPDLSWVSRMVPVLKLLGH